MDVILKDGSRGEQEFTEKDGAWTFRHTTSHILAQAVTYCATAPKSNASYMAINKALEDVEKNRIQPIPYALRDPHSAGGKENQHGKGYIYPHDTGGFAVQDYMSVPVKYYNIPGKGIGYEMKIKERLDYFDSLRKQGVKNE